MSFPQMSPPRCQQEHGPRGVSHRLRNSTSPVLATRQKGRRVFPGPFVRPAASGSVAGEPKFPTHSNRDEVRHPAEVSVLLILGAGLTLAQGGVDPTVGSPF